MAEKKGVTDEIIGIGRAAGWKAGFLIIQLVVETGFIDKTQVLIHCDDTAYCQCPILER
jgi:hypothetical protein